MIDYRTMRDKIAELIERELLQSGKKDMSISEVVKYMLGNVEVYNAAKEIWGNYAANEILWELEDADYELNNK